MITTKKSKTIYQKWTNTLNDHIKDIVNDYLFKEQKEHKKIIDKTFNNIYLRYSRKKNQSPFLSYTDCWSISPEIIDSVKAYISVSFAKKIFERCKNNL